MGEMGVGREATNAGAVGLASLPRRARHDDGFDRCVAACPYLHSTCCTCACTLGQRACTLQPSAKGKSKHVISPAGRVALGAARRPASKEMVISCPVQDRQRRRIVGREG
jgi:hypothetical protein